MKMTRMINPCSDCPFRSDKPLYLSPRRAQEFANTLQRDASFSCHKTVDWHVEVEVDEDGMELESAASTAEASFCAGAIGTMVNERAHFNNVLIRLLASRRPDGDTWPETINTTNLYPSLDAWVAAHYEQCQQRKL